MRAPAQNEEIARWIREHALTLDHLGTLRPTLQGVRVVGLGEATHGTKEFFQARLRLLQYLVTELGFNTVAVEASYSGAQQVNRYVLTGEGECSAAVSALGFVACDVAEFAAIVDWLRTHNESAAKSAKVQFFGLDTINTKPGRAAVLEWLGRVDSATAAAFAEIFSVVAAAEARGQLAAYHALSADLLARLRDQIDRVEASRARYVNQTSETEYEEIARQLNVIFQWVQSNVPNETSLRKKGLDVFVRSRQMAENLQQRMELQGPDAKVVVLAHNFHLGIGYEDTTHGLVRNMGLCLRERFGDEYYVVGFELHHGSYLARVHLREEEAAGDLTIGEIPFPPDDSLPACLAQADCGDVILNLRGVAAPPSVSTWLDDPQTMHLTGWVRSEPPQFYTTRSLRRTFDAVLFIHATSATTPTAQARRTVSERTGH
jgi:erythromycin esterase